MPLLWKGCQVGASEVSARLGGLRRLLRPAHIAVIGGREAEEVIRQCDRVGFAGEIWPVNPRRSQMGGRPCFPSVEALPGSPDAAFVGVSRRITVDVVRALADRGAGGAVCYASGFAEIGGDGVLLQEELTAAMGDVALVGPNCYGLLNYLDGVALWPDRHGGRRLEKGVAIVTQSGNVGLSLTMEQRSAGLAYLISVGNQAGVPIHEYVEALLEDQRVTAIGLHLEGLTDVAAFSRAAIKALAKKVPLVALKSGRSAEGGRIAMSHTSSLAGADRLYDALFRRVGVMRVQTLSEFVEALKFLSVVGPLSGNKIASISCSGGEAGLVADAAEAAGLPMPPLVEAQESALAEVLGERVALGNPLDYHTYIWGDEEAQKACFSAMMLGEQDITLKLLDFPRPELEDDLAWVQTARAFVRAVAERGTRGAVVSTLPENLPAEAREMLRSHSIAPMQGLEECLVAIRGAAEIYQKQRHHQEIQPLVCAPHVNGRATLLDEAESKNLLGRFGVPFPRSAVCEADEVGQMAAEIGFPVAIKMLSSDIVHKTDVGGVRLNLNDREAAQQAAGEMRELGDRFLVEAMANQAAAPLGELILGLSRDPQFGLTLLVGAGGVLVELLVDSATLLFPVSAKDVETALASLRIAPLLAGYRGMPAADTRALTDAILALARFAEAHAGQVEEVDVNPLFVFPAGQGVMAVDASVRIIPGT